MNLRVVFLSSGWGKISMSITSYMFKPLILTLMSLWVVFALADDHMTRIGYAFDSDTNQLLYTESHHEKYSDGLIKLSEVIYRDTEENIFARKVADFSRSQFMPEFALKNILTGHKEKTRYIEEKYEVIFSQSKNNPEKESQISYKENAISDAGFDNFIIKHWDEIISGEKYKRYFLVPSMQDFLSFRIYQNTIIEKDGRKLRLINIEPDSFFVRMIAGTLKLYYDFDKPALRIFEGVSNLRDEKGNNYNVVIKYEDVKTQALKANKNNITYLF